MKICRICKIPKDVSEFYKHVDTLDKLRSECKSCWKDLCLSYRSGNLDRVKKLQRKNHFKRNYNLELSELEELLETVKVCSICKLSKQLVVDHNHKTGKVRSLLCNQCNQGLGSFYENKEYLNNAIKYLETHND